MPARATFPCVTRKSITTSHTVVACDVCGRRLLRGERAENFIAGGSRRVVCELCTARAAHEGWLREGLDEIAVRGHGNGRSGSRFGRLRARREAFQSRVEGAPEPVARERYRHHRRARSERGQGGPNPGGRRV